MTVSQTINHINENNYDDDITVTDVPKGHFTAVTENVFASGSSTREIRVELLPLEQHSGGTVTTNTGLFVKQNGETAIKVTVMQNGQELGANTVNYS